MDAKHLEIIQKARHSHGKLEGLEHQFIDQLYRRGSDGELLAGELQSLESIGRRIGLLEKNEIDRRVEATMKRKRSMGSGRRRGRH